MSSYMFRFFDGLTSTAPIARSENEAIQNKIQYFSFLIFCRRSKILIAVLDSPHSQSITVHQLKQASTASTNNSLRSPFIILISDESA